ncbi:N4-gp56 family major capsid protein [Nocardioides sp. R1-1]|uniref:N4-gp56 family major capsid protein n=1 Tax=Nocardioides sp. R1-1 TaxID=3383502 RepID=UPI0038D1A84C
MTQTTSANVFVPEVYEDTAQAAFTGAVRVAGSAAVVESPTLEGSPGDTVTFPKWGLIGELDELSETVALVPAPMSTSSATATIKEVGKAVEITDKARLVSLGDPEAEAARQFGIMNARKVDADLIACAQADETAQGGGLPLSHNASAGQTTLSWDRIVDAIAKFGDEWAPEDFAGIYINSAQQADLMRDANFISADKLGSTGTAIARGQIGAVAGVAVFVTDRVAAKKVLIIKRGALGLLHKKRPSAEKGRDQLARTDVISTTAHYAVKRLNDKGVCVLTLAAA